MPDTSENEGSPTPEDFIRGALVIVLFFAVLFIIAALYLPPVGSGDHPPQVGITRAGDIIYIQWKGGTDDAFVGDFQVMIDNQTTQYKKPELNGMVATVYHPEYTCVNVSAMDKAVRIYKPIGNNCT